MFSGGKLHCEVCFEAEKKKSLGEFDPAIEIAMSKLAKPNSRVRKNKRMRGWVDKAEEEVRVLERRAAEAEQRRQTSEAAAAVAERRAHDADKAALVAERKVIKMAKLPTEFHWTYSVAKNGYKMNSSVGVILLCIAAIPLGLIGQCVDTARAMPDSDFQPMGGQARGARGAEFTDSRLQHELPRRDSRSCFSQLLIFLKMHLFVAGYKYCRGHFIIRGGAKQYYHTDAGHWHSLSVFVGLADRVLRFARLGGGQFTKRIRKGDVLIFNNTVWHAGDENDRDASVLFYYFDMEQFVVLPPSVRAESPERQHCVDRLGFNSMMDDEEFAVYSATFESDQQVLVIPDEEGQACTLLEAAARIMRALVHEQVWSVVD